MSWLFKIQSNDGTVFYRVYRFVQLKWSQWKIELRAITSCGEECQNHHCSVFWKVRTFPHGRWEESQIQWPWGFVLLIKYIMLGQFPTVKDFWPDKSPWSEDLKWISLSTTIGKCPFSICEAPWIRKKKNNAISINTLFFYFIVGAEIFVWIICCFSILPRKSL